MITLPYQFIPTQYDGYFINVDTGTVYSFKRGFLKELVKFRDKGKSYGYVVSVGGVKKYIKLVDIANALAARQRDHMIPVQIRGYLDLHDGYAPVEVFMCM